MKFIMANAGSPQFAAGLVSGMLLYRLTFGATERAEMLRNLKHYHKQLDRQKMGEEGDEDEYK